MTNPTAIAEEPRFANLLRGMGATVVGLGESATTAADILRVMGGSVIRVDEVVSAADVRGLDSADLVLCDLVEKRVSQDYLEGVAGRRSGVWVTISAFGIDGPRGRVPGSDLVCAAAGGLLGSVRDAEGGVYPVPGFPALRVAGQIGALAALHGISLRRGGLDPIHLDVSAQEAVAFCSVQQECAHLLYECPGPGGPGRYSAPSGTFSCCDGELQISVLDDHQWVRLSEVLGRKDWPVAYPTNAARVENAELINSVVAAWTAEQSKFTCEKLLQAGGVAAAAIRSIREVATCEQFAVRGFVSRTDRGVLDCPKLPALVDQADKGESPEGPSRSPQSLTELRVAEITNVLAGPLAGAILGAMGAEVVRLEEEDRLDLYRRNGPFQSGESGRERAAYYMFANYNKRSISRRVGTDVEFTHSVLGWADVVFENIGPRRMDRLRDGRPDGHPKTTVSISGFGRTGPCADYKAYASTIHAFAGLSGAVSEVSNGDALIRTSLADYYSAVWAASLTAAWWLGCANDATIDVSMAEVAASKLNGCSLNHTGPPEEEHDQALLRLRDGHVAIAGPAGASYKAVLSSLGVPDLVGDERAAGVAMVDLRSDPRGRDEIFEAARHAGLASYVTRSAAELFDDAQLLARGFVIHLDHPVVGSSPIFALPWKLAGQARSGYRRAPLLGEDDEWIEKALAETAAFDEARF